MAYVVEAERTIAFPPEIVFDRLADHSSWPRWMPRSFVPVGEGKGTLEVGDRVKVKVAGAPMASPIRVSVVDRPREIAWRGGVGSVLAANHRFLLEDDGRGGTRVHSVETFTGVLAAIGRLLVTRIAARVGREQLEGLARSFER